MKKQKVFRELTTCPASFDFDSWQIVNDRVAHRRAKNDPDVEPTISVRCGSGIESSGYGRRSGFGSSLYRNGGGVSVFT
jgi:hypothetical protein